jgi:asparagine synthase (glutamine-hydrolysing)
MPAAARSLVRGAEPYLPARLRRGARTVGAPDVAARYIALTGNIDARLRRDLVRGPLAARDGLDAWRAVNARAPNAAGVLSATLELDAALGLVDDMLHYFDRASMAHSLEVRVPFLDHELVELCSGIPQQLKVKDGVTKVLLKRAARGLVPDHIVDKPKVGFFNAAVESWFSTLAGREASDVLLDPGARYVDMLDREKVCELLVRQRANGSGGVGQALLAIPMLETWLSTFVDRATESSTTDRAAAQNRT